jgi:hypothetical protein
MESREIPSNQWAEFVANFSKFHVGWPVTIETLDQELGDQYLSKDLPLMGMSFDTKGSEPGTLKISAGDNPDIYLDHRVHLPLHIRLEEDTPGGAGSIEIEPAQGPKTLIGFRPPRELPQ